MNILFSALTYPDEKYPFSAFIKVLCEEMTKQGHNITVVAPQSLTGILLKGERKLPIDVSYEVKTDNGTKFIRVLRPLVIRFGHILIERLSWKAEQRAFSHIVRKKNINFDVIYAHFWNSAYNALEIAISSKKPLFVATGEDTVYAHNVVSKKDLLMIENYTKGVICVSSQNKQVSINSGLTTAEKCIVLPNAVDSNLFFVKDKNECRKKLGFPIDSFIVAFCGRFVERKGVRKLCSAINLLKELNIKSIFIGSNLGGKSEEPNCHGILFKGMLNHDKITDYLNCADVFVLPSLSEGCPNSVVEAMACGLPIISSALPFNRDICNGDNSILIDPLNVEEIAEAIRSMMMDQERRKLLSEGAIKTASALDISIRTHKILQFMQTRMNKV